VGGDTAQAALRLMRGPLGGLLATKSAHSFLEALWGVNEKGKAPVLLLTRADLACFVGPGLVILVSQVLKHLDHVLPVGL
jgi:hypothetical protein